jgi:hypothetical protein
MMSLRFTSVSHTYHRASIIWIMAALVLFVALAPTISKVLASNGADARGGWIEVCSTSGTKFVQVKESDSPTDESVNTQVVHCPFCLPHYQFRTVPTLGITYFFFPPSRETAAYIPAPEPIRAQTQWRPDRSRAPPVIS